MRRPSRKSPRPKCHVGSVIAGWFITWVVAIERRDARGEANARAELARFGIHVLTDGRNTLMPDLKDGS